MPYTYTLTTTIPAVAREIYDAWLDSEAHSDMTGSDAVMSDELGAEVSAWDGYITGRNLELVPGERIVQSWRTTEFDDDDEDSIITITLEEADDGTVLTLEHSNVPDAQRSYEEGGWQSSYFDPMVAYFAKRRLETSEAAPEEPAPAAVDGVPREQPVGRGEATPRPATKAKRTASRARSGRAAPRRKPTPRAKAKRPATRAKARRPAARAKPAPRRGKSKQARRGGAATRARKRATSKARKPRRPGKRR